MRFFPTTYRWREYATALRERLTEVSAGSLQERSEPAEARAHR